MKKKEILKRVFLNPKHRGSTPSKKLSLSQKVDKTLLGVFLERKQ